MASQLPFTAPSIRKLSGIVPDERLTRWIRYVGIAPNVRCGHPPSLGKTPPTIKTRNPAQRMNRKSLLVVLLGLGPAHGSAQDSLPVSCVGVDLQSPMEDLVRCAESGDAGAQYGLGLNHEFGAPIDLEEAVRWYRLSADQGYGPGQLSLGLAYRDGRGVTQDLVYAYMWFSLSAAEGAAGNPARSNKELIEQLMTPEQIAEAQRLSREWMEPHP